MFKKELVVIGVLLAGAIVYGLLANAHRQKVEARDREASERRDAFISQIADTCHAAIQDEVSPQRVLDFSHNYGTPYDAGGYSPTDTGYSYRVIADLGGNRIRFKCYMNKNFEMLNLARDI